MGKTETTFFKSIILTKGIDLYLTIIVLQQRILRSWKWIFLWWDWKQTKNRRKPLQQYIILWGNDDKYYSCLAVRVAIRIIVILWRCKLPRFSCLFPIPSQKFLILYYPLLKSNYNQLWINPWADWVVTIVIKVGLIWTYYCHQKVWLNCHLKLLSIVLLFDFCV